MNTVGTIGLGHALHELESELVAYSQLSTEEKKAARHVLYQQTGFAGRLLFENFYEPWLEWIAERSWFMCPTRTTYYGAVGGKILWCSEYRFVGLEVQVAWAMFSAENPDATMGGVK